MLQKYIELLKNGIDAVTNLSFQNATFMDYLTAVGYEFLILLLGVLMLAGVAAALALPYLLLTKTNEWFNKKIEEIYSKRAPWDNLLSLKSIYNCSSYSIERDWKAIEKTLAAYPNEEGFAELLEAMKSTVRQDPCGIFIDRSLAFSRMEILDMRYKISDRARKMFDKINRKANILHYTNITVNITAHVILVLLIIPFVLMFF